MASNWAIVIGINDYLHHPERKLNYAVNDAQQMGKFLSDRAGFDAEQVIQCLGDEAYRGSATYPTCSNLLRVLEQDLKPDRRGKIDRLWFYFSGHGVSRNGRDYLITSDCLEDKIDRFGLPIDEVIAALQLHKDADIVLILDACRQVLGKKNFDNPIGEETIAVARERGITTIFSCDYGQYSYELEALQQGAFTYALIEGLAQHTLPYQLETYLRQRVPALHLQHRRDQVIQTPRIRIEPATKAFHPLLPHAVTPTDIVVLVDRAREAELDEDFETAKQIWWQIIESPRSSDHIREARTAIDRIDRKTARFWGDRSASALAMPPSNFKDVEQSTANLSAQTSPQPETISEPSESSHAFDQVTDTRLSEAPSEEVKDISEEPSLEESETHQFKWTRQRFLKLAIPVGIGVGISGFTIADRFLEPSIFRLEKFLKAGKWKEADQETGDLMLKAANREKEGYLLTFNIENFPCDVLSRIDQLWVNHSDGKFGFSIQQRIWQDCGSPTTFKDDWTQFFVQIGWGVKADWLSYSGAKFKTSASTGYLPLPRWWLLSTGGKMVRVLFGDATWGTGWWAGVSSLQDGGGYFFSRVKTCGL